LFFQLDYSDDQKHYWLEKNKSYPAFIDKDDVGQIGKNSFYRGDQCGYRLKLSK